MLSRLAGGSPRQTPNAAKLATDSLVAPKATDTASARIRPCRPRISAPCTGLAQLSLPTFKAHSNEAIGTVDGITGATVVALTIAGSKHVAIVVSSFATEVIETVIERLPVHRFRPAAGDRQGTVVSAPTRLHASSLVIDEEVFPHTGEAFLAFEGTVAVLDISPIALKSGLRNVVAETSLIARSHRTLDALAEIVPRD